MEALNKMETKITIFQRIRKRQLQFLEHIMRNMDVEKLTFIGHFEGKMGRKKNLETYRSSLFKWMSQYKFGALYRIKSYLQKIQQSYQFCHLSYVAKSLFSISLKQTGKIYNRLKKLRKSKQTIK